MSADATPTFASTPVEPAVRAGEDVYANNLAVLWTTDAPLARRIEAVPDDAWPRTQPSKSGLPTLSVTADDGSAVVLHSRHRPDAEAQTLLKSIEIDQHTAFIVYGFGLGYHVRSLIEQAGKEAVVVVFEPDVRVLRAAMESMDLVATLESSRLLLLADADKAEVFGKLGPHTAVLNMGPGIVKHGPSVRARPTFFAMAEQLMADYLSYARTTMNTVVLNGRRTSENVARNLGAYMLAQDVNRLHGCRRGTPAIVVSAGPSLRKNIHHIKAAAGKATIIAVQTALKPLLDAGVEPDFVTSLDWSDISSRFFEYLPRGLKTQLVAEPKAAAKVMDAWLAGGHGPVTLVGNEFAENLLNEARPAKGRLRSGATVAHLAFYLAEHIGCDPIIFVGQDLGFADGLCYAPGTAYDDVWRPETGPFCTFENKQWEQIVRDRPILRRVADWQGKPAYTEERLFTYLQQFERDFAESRAKIIDATEGGILKKGSVCMPLTAAIAQHCQADVTELPEPDLRPKLNQLTSAVSCLRRRCEEAGRIASIAGQTLPLLQRIVDRIENQDEVNRIIVQIDHLRRDMHRMNLTFGLITQLAQGSEMKRFEADRRIASSKAEGLEKQRRQVQRDLASVAGILEAAQTFAAMSAETAETFDALLSTPQEVAA